MDVYPGDDNWLRFASMLSDIRTVCPLMNLAEITSNSIVENVYTYVATQPRSGVMGGIADVSSDTSAIFDVYNSKNEAEKMFVQNMQDIFL